ncbi:FAD-dependent oxidoreductase [Loigolactobacillus bifermentans]|uniref:Fumarate reductase (Flavoprotein) n=1 Tax=Loigolactobacillus bifermentans DSM 20003 TaxID=1423726 RepID=A0A0R1GMN6_9LACO|nr:FAD-binding protein [Loigolactobacillus bifermentans]KRK32562.1 fumarate reductase (flavoprotein) [Loigolactobacillus bifermentans DSM 20003]QGG60233.1 FAD-binding protein [Loigolactobacillus bifermentans]
MKEITTQVVVIGSGSSGISAAMQLVENNVSFVLLEKGDKLGGAGKFGAHGVYGIDSADQKKHGVDYHFPAALQEMTQQSHYLVNGPLMSRVLKKSAATIDWMAKFGLATSLTPNAQPAHLYDQPIYHEFNSFDERFTAWDHMAQIIKDSGNQILTETAGVALDYGADGLKAVIAEQADSKLRIHCQSVVIGDGGYPGNPAMMQKAFADAGELMNLGERKATGDGIAMVAAIGGDVQHNPVIFAHGCAPSFQVNPMKRDNKVEALTNLPLLWVNKIGERFTNEEVVYDFAQWGNVAHAEGGYYYMLFDQATLDHFQTQQVNWEDAFSRQFTEPEHEPVLTAGPYATLQQDVAAVIAAGDGAKADTISELAAQLDVPTEQLATTLATYNAAIDQQADPQFAKQAKFLKFKVSAGPFYAVKERCAILGTLNGVNVNANLEALRPNRTPIKGVYVVGNNANGLYSDAYSNFEGIANGFAWISGRIAADETTKYLATLKQTERV